ncbi:MAG: lytic murein transglycosylase B [Gammaproteobacteria bacterium]
MTKIFQATSMTLVLLMTATFSSNINAEDPPFEERADTRAFIDKMVKEHDFDKEKLKALFKKVKLREEVISSMNTQAEAKPWYAYKKNLVTDARTQKGVEFWQQHVNALERAEQDYGIPPEIIIAILGIETNYGATQGSFRVLDTLATFGFEYPRRADFFKSELEAFLLLTRENDLDPIGIDGSYAGAIGQPQFMPSSYRHYAVDYNGSGTADLRNSVSDVIGSVANYLKENGWKPGQAVIVQVEAVDENKHLEFYKLKPTHSIHKLQQRGIEITEDLPSDSLTTFVVLEGEDKPEHWVGFQNFYTISRYNPSKHYAMAVYQLAEKIKKNYKQKIEAESKTEAEEK